VHGGVRYLEQGNVALVLEALKERGLLRQNAPHLVSDLAFVVPNYEWWEAPFYGMGLKVYNLLAGRYGFGTSEILSREETLARLPTIKTDGLRGGVVYYDSQFDDARLLAAAERTKIPVVFGAYPITPASDILHELALHKRFRVRTFQAEDEIAAATAAIGASFGGCIGVTASSGPGIALKGEAIGLAVTAELPLVIFDIQRGGPSTGLPTKTEQADLMQALYGRNSESPVVVIAPATPGDCFYIAYEAVRLAVKYMVPVMVLSDGYLANGSEPWLIPDIKTLPEIPVSFRTEAEGFFPYLRDPATLARPWVRPGTPGLEHRIGGLEKQDVTGNISYDPENHDHMVRTRAEKVRRVAQEIPPTSINGPATGDLLVVGWGGTYGAITAAVEQAQAAGKSVASIHLRHLSPLPPDLGHILREYRKVLVPEINSGQLVRVLRAEYLVDAVGFNRVRGLPLPSEEIYEAIDQLLGSKP